MVFRQYEKEKYTIWCFLEGYNHKLLSPENRRFQNLKRNLTLYQKKMILDTKLNIRATKTYIMYKEKVGGYESQRDIY